MGRSGLGQVQRVGFDRLSLSGVGYRTNPCSVRIAFLGLAPHPLSLSRSKATRRPSNYPAVAGAASGKNGIATSSSESSVRRKV